MSNAPVYSALIIGAGNIGAFFDSPESSDVLTHAHAYTLHPGFRLAGFVDSDYARAQEAARIWGQPAFKTFAEAFQTVNIDTVSVCVPDEVHNGVLTEVLRYPVKLVFAEKPLAKTLQQAEAIVALAETKKIPVVVNYSRRFVRELTALKQDIADNKHGRFIAGSGMYGKGILHNGTHMLDLLMYLLGDIRSAHETSRIYDFYRDDPTVSAVLEFDGNALFSLQGIDCRSYTIFEADLLFEKARIRLVDSCFEIEEYHVKESAKFTGYKNLYRSGTSATDLNRAMLNAVEHIYSVLRDNAPVRCSARDAYTAMQAAMRFDRAGSHV
jgi:predicted dehydrogenase